MGNKIYLNTYFKNTRPSYMMLNNKRCNAGYFNDEIMWGQMPSDYVEPLKFTALDDGCKLGWYRQQEKAVYSSDNGETWQLFPFVPRVIIYTPSGEPLDEYFINVPKGSSVLVKGTESRLSNSLDDHYKFMTKGTGRFSCTGDVLSMVSMPVRRHQWRDVSGHTWICGVVCAYEFCYLFAGTNITTAPKLPRPFVWSDGSVGERTMLKDHCFHSMFKDCIYLESAPDIYKEYDLYRFGSTVSSHMFISMFEGCTSLTSARYLTETITGISQHAADIFHNVAENGTIYFTNQNIAANFTYPTTGLPTSWQKIVI